MNTCDISSFKRQSIADNAILRNDDNCGQQTKKRLQDDDVKDNEQMEVENVVIHRSKLMKLASEINNVCTLSPVTEISISLSDTSLGTPVRGWRTNEIDGEEGSDSDSGPGIQNDDNHCNTEETEEDTRLIANTLPQPRSKRPNFVPMSLNFDDDKSSMAVDDVSFYDSPQHSTFPPSPSMLNDGLLSDEGSPQRFTIVQNESNLRVIGKLRSSDEIDNNSVDSGYGTTSFKFPGAHSNSSSSSSLPSTSVASTKLSEPSPRTAQNVKKTSPKSFRIFHSLSSGSTESMDDEYMELFEMESLGDDEVEPASMLPSDLNSLISGDIKTIKTTPDMKRPPVRRCLSLNESNTMRARSALFEPKTPEFLKTVQQSATSTSTTPYSSRLTVERCFKRPEPPSATASPVQKRYKGDEKENSMMEDNCCELLVRPCPLRKSMSMNDAHIMTALSRSSSEPDLIGDFSKPFVLPLMNGRHSDLKSISSETMANLINGQFKNTVASFKIIDCRYPYEFEGGHIRGAQNLYTHEQIIDELVNCKTEAPTVEAEGPKRHILVFHCEFSSERGPKLSRFLRNHDRMRNSNTYPALHYPEIYLLHGGYKEFFETHSELCDPIAYRPMLHPSYGEAYKHFRAKSKSWNGEVKDISTSSAGQAVNRLKKSRSRLVL